jgi:hypothetical protein
MPVKQNAPDAASYIADDIAERPSQASSKSESIIRSGWDAANSLVSPAGDFPTEVKFDENVHQIFKFIDQDGPFAIYKQHFLKQKTSGKRSYVCLVEGCPLCIKLEDRPENKRAFTVINCSAEGGPQRQQLICGSRLFQALHAAHYSAQGPLTKGYWSIVRIGKGPSTMYTVAHVKERDLEEDWNINPVVAEEVAASAEPYPRNSIKEHTVEELNEIADSLL